MPVRTKLYLQASTALAQLADACQDTGEEWQAERFAKYSADIELASEELQLCWGGPLNGQRGRQALFSEMLKNLNPTAVVETGSYRGITTKWFAENFSGSVLSCEQKREYFYQATHNTATFTNVKVEQADSRLFLSGLSIVDIGDRPFFYLDAHWEKSLPLKEEIEIIVREFPDATLAIDDFEVPGDPGYGWDNYGPDAELQVKYLKGCLSPEYRIYFPVLPSAMESGARRGFCLVSKSAIPLLEAMPELKSGSLSDWELFAHCADIKHSVQSTPLVGVHTSLDSSSLERSYPDQIQGLSDLLERTQSELEESAQQVVNLKQVCDERLSAIENLTRECYELQSQLAAQVKLSADLKTACEERLLALNDLAATNTVLQDEIGKSQAFEAGRTKIINELKHVCDERVRAINYLTAECNARERIIEQLSKK